MHPIRILIGRSRCSAIAPDASQPITPISIVLRGEKGIRTKQPAAVSRSTIVSPSLSYFCFLPLNLHDVQIQADDALSGLQPDLKAVSVENHLSSQAGCRKGNV